MNPGLTDDHVSIRYYDSDYPSANGSRYPENFDAITEYQGLAHDIDRYRGIAGETGGPILELCCGTGRVAIPLARDGHDVDGLDIMPSMLEALRGHVADEPREVQERIRVLAGDARSFKQDRSYALVIVAFNSLLCIPDFESQCAVLERIAAHLLPEGRLVLDVVNPLQLSLKGDPVPKPFRSLCRAPKKSSVSRRASGESANG